MKSLLALIILCPLITFANSKTCNLAEIEKGGVKEMWEAAIPDSNELILETPDKVFKARVVLQQEVEAIGASVTLTSDQISTNGFFLAPATHPFLSLTAGGRTVQIQCWLD